MDAILILIPLAGALLALALPSNRWRPLVLPMAGAAHLSMALQRIADGGTDAEGRVSLWLALDPVSRLVMLLVSTVFLFAAIYAVGYLRQKAPRPNRIFCASFLTVFAMMNMVMLARHLGLMWVAAEAATLASAPLIYFNHSPRSIEATWKYLLVGSVGIALALLGTFFLAYACLAAGLPPTLDLAELLRCAPQLSKPWLHAAFALLLIGYGTKMGLAPMHAWKPDAYGEAPGVVGMLLAGGLTNCAFLALIRVWHVCHAAGEGGHVGTLLVFFGLLSMAVAAVFMTGQRDIKRMLAYSSIEHMGILALGLGLGGAALFGTLLHMVNNGITKGVLFLSAANIHRAYGGKTIDDVRGAMRRLPLSGGLFLAGFLAITGAPPFAPFISEFSIITAAIGMERFWSAGLFLVILMIVFVGMGSTVLAVLEGKVPSAARETPYRDGLWTGGAPLALMGGVLLLGLSIPSPLMQMLLAAVRYLETTP